MSLLLQLLLLLLGHVLGGSRGSQLLLLLLLLLLHALLPPGVHVTSQCLLCQSIENTTSGQEHVQCDEGISCYSLLNHLLPAVSNLLGLQKHCFPNSRPLGRTITTVQVSPIVVTTISVSACAMSGNLPRY